MESDVGSLSREELEAEVVRLRASRRAEGGEAGGQGAEPSAVSRESLLAMVEATRVPMILTDPGLPDDPIVFANRAFRELSGYGDAELLGRNCRFLQGEGTAPDRVRAIREALAEGREAAIDILNYRRDGTPFLNELHVRPLRDADGRLVHHFGSQADVTGYREANRQLRESEDHLRHTVELNPQVPWTCDPAGNITSYSNRWLELTGQAPGEPDGAGWMKALHPDDVPHTVEVFSRCLATGEPVDVDYRIRIAATGEHRWMRARARPRRGAEGGIVAWYGVVEDIHDRRLAEEALRASEARYRTLFETVEVGFCIIRMRFDGGGRAVDYLIEEANPAFARQTGADVAGRWVSEFAPGLERHWFDSYGKVALTGEPAHFENYAAVFGRWFDVRAHRVGDARDRRVAVFFTDITARRSAERRAEDSARELRLIADALPVLIAFIDAGHVYRFANEAYRDWFSMAPEEVVGRDVRELLGQAAYSARKAFVDRALGGEPVLFEIDWPRADGRPRVAEIRYLPRRDGDGAVDGIHVFVQDVTDRRMAEILLRSQNEELGAQVAARTAERDEIWRASSDLLCVASLDGRFTGLNPAWTATLGWTEDELRGKPFIDFVHPDDRAATLAALEGLGRGDAQLSFENRYMHRDGGHRWLSWNAVPRGGLVYSAVRDVTEAKAAAEALAAAAEALRQSQKMEAVGQLTGGLAHDFNNMLAGIVGSLELMQTRMLQGRMGDMERYIGAAQGAARRAAALTHRLLAFSRRQTLDPKPTDVNRLVEGMLELVRRTVGPAVTVDFVGMGGLWPTLVDPSQLENALLNLCINARDAMPDGGRVTVETGNRWLDERGARERDLAPGQYVSLCVSDTGTGMTPDVLSKAFDPFFTTKPIGEGTGLGLSMIYGFAKQSGGQVRIYSEVGEGTMVCVYLPRHLGEAEASGPAPDLSEAARAKAGETVLVVDDEPTVRMLVTEVLEDLGYAAIEAGDAASGLKVLRSDVRIDLLVTDVGLPGGMNGRQMADAAREHRPGLKVLFITGYAENAVLNHGHLAHGTQVMTKPFAMEALAIRIRGIIEGRAGTVP